MVTSAENATAGFNIIDATKQTAENKIGNIVSDNTVTNRYSGKVQGNLLDLYDIPT